MAKNGNIDLETMKRTDDGWKYLSEASDVFEEKVNSFLRNAAYYANAKEFCVGAPFENENNAIMLETYHYGSKKFVLSYTSGIQDRDLDCQYRIFKRIDFSLDKDGNLVINEMSGRLESKYGYSFENTNGGILKTDYSYQAFTKEGIELLYRGYSDEINVPKEHFWNYDTGLRACVKNGYNPRLDLTDNYRFDGDLSQGKNSRFVELSRSLDNLGLVKEIKSVGNKKSFVENSDISYQLNSFSETKHTIDPYLIHINRGVLPIAYVKDGKLGVNYAECGVKPDNYQDLAKFRFTTGAEEKMKELQSELEDLPKEDTTHRTIISGLIDKYDTLSHMYEVKKRKNRTGK